MKKKIIYSVIIIALMVFALYKSTILFVYTNPYTETSVFKYIAPTVAKLSNSLDAAREYSKNEGYDFEYVFLDPYGSGFLKHNPIPNDLDMEVGLYLGDYEYDGKNGEELAEEIVKKIESFRYAFNFIVNSNNKDIYMAQTPFELLHDIETHHSREVWSISSSLNNVVEGKNYIKFVYRTFHRNKYSYKVDFPYMMSSNELLLTGYPAIIMMAENMKYSKNTRNYLREISVIPQFYINLKYKDKTTLVEIIPESYFGARLHLKRRFFASSIFANKYSIDYLKNLPLLTDDNQYVFFRLLSFKRHLLEIENIVETGYDRPLKIYKRIMQAADMVQPLLEPEMYKGIEQYVEKNLSNRDLVLLNEYENISGVLHSVQRAPGMFLKLHGKGIMQNMYNQGSEILDELYANGNADKKYLDEIKEFHETKFKPLLSAKSEYEIILLPMDKRYSNLKIVLRKAMLPLIEDKDKIDETIKVFNSVFINAGFHKTYLYWLDPTTIGVIKDNYTKDIKDVKQFAIDNGLAEMQYKLIDKSQIPSDTLKYEIWTRFNPTEIEIQNYNEMVSKLLKDKKNFNIKKRLRR